MPLWFFRKRKRIVRTAEVSREKEASQTEVGSEPEVRASPISHSSSTEMAQVFQSKRSEYFNLSQTFFVIFMDVFLMSANCFPFAVKLLAQRQKASDKEEASAAAISKEKEKRKKKVQDVVLVREVSPPRPEVVPTSVAAKRTSLLSNPKIHQLAQKPGSGLPEVLWTVSNLMFLSFAFLTLNLHLTSCTLVF